MLQDNAELKEKIVKGLNRTYQKLIQEKRDRNLDLVISKNGKVISINAKNY